MSGYGDFAEEFTGPVTFGLDSQIQSIGCCPECGEDRWVIRTRSVRGGVATDTEEWADHAVR